MLECLFGQSYLPLLTCRLYIYLHIKLTVKASALLELGCADPLETSERAVDVSGYLGPEI